MDDRGLEQRLAGYRPVVERAVARRPLAPRRGRDRRWVVSAVAAATVAAGVVGWVALGNGDEPAGTGTVQTTIGAMPPATGETWVFTCNPTDDAGPDTTVGPMCVNGGSAERVEPPVVVAFGDSVMLGAESLLSDAGVTVDAVVSRQLSDLDAVDLDVAAQSSDVVVLHIGNNGPINTRDLDRVITSLADVPRVVVLTLFNINGPWLRPNNELLRLLPARFPNVIVLDWEVLAGMCIQDCFATDEFHLTEAGAEFYTALITNLLDTTSATTAP